MSVPDFPLPSHIEMNSMGSSIARPGDQHHALKTNTNANGALRGEERPLDEKHSHSTRLLFKPSTAKPRYMISYQQYEYPEKGRSGWRRVRERVTVVLLSIIAILFLVFTKGHLVTEPWHALENRFSPWRFNAKAASLAQASSTTSSVLTPTASVLNVFQVHQPVFVTQSSNNGPNGGSPASCTVLLMEHSFGWSYGMPFVGNYTPPSCEFNRVVMNFTVTSRGRQFDRLALMYFGDTEVWRTSTAELTTAGIIWTYTKDMSEYLYFWKEFQKIIFDLGNLVDDTYTGLFSTTLTATFFMGEESNAAALIIPISARQSSTDSASVFMLPDSRAVNTINFPRNANRAVFTVSACGQASEEFWWSNVLQSDTETFVPVIGSLPGYSSWREVQIYIDGQLAGVEWPFPTIFTGGVVPGLWRPIVGIDAFDLAEHEIDITPWLPQLSDGKEHSFEIKVAGLLASNESAASITETVGNSWYVTGKIFLWLDSADSITSGSLPKITAPDPTFYVSHALTQTSTGANDTLSYITTASRSFAVSSLVKTQSGARSATWSQNLAYSNHGLFTAAGAIQAVTLSTSGNDAVSGRTTYSSEYSYPLFSNTTYLVDPSGSGNFSLQADLSWGLRRKTTGDSVFPSGLENLGTEAKKSFEGSVLETVQNGSAYYFGSPSAKIAVGYGRTSQEFWFQGVGKAGEGEGQVGAYARSVEAVNGTVVRDKEVVAGVKKDKLLPKPADGGDVKSQVVLEGPREALGRGPGTGRREGAGRVLVMSGGEA